MAKPLGPKSILIREAITANPDKGNSELAALLSAAPERKTDKLKVTAQDVAAQKQAMKQGGTAKAPTAATAAPAQKAAGNGRRKPGRKPGKKPGTAPTAAAPRPVATSGSPVDLIDKTFALAQECGGMEQLKRLVERLAEVRAG
jgi:hypothetical protein